MCGAVAPVSLLRHHVAHRPGFHRRQFFFVDGGRDGLARLSFRASRQDQAGPRGRGLPARPRGGTVVAGGNPGIRGQTGRSLILILPAARIPASLFS